MSNDDMRLNENEIRQIKQALKKKLAKMAFINPVVLGILLGLYSIVFLYPLMMPKHSLEMYPYEGLMIKCLAYCMMIALLFVIVLFVVVNSYRKRLILELNRTSSIDKGDSSEDSVSNTQMIISRLEGDAVADEPQDRAERALHIGKQLGAYLGIDKRPSRWFTFSFGGCKGLFGLLVLAMVYIAKSRLSIPLVLVSVALAALYIPLTIGVIDRLKDKVGIQLMAVLIAMQTTEISEKEPTTRYT